MVRFDSAALGRAMLEAGVGLMLMREELANQGLEQGTLAVSPIARAEYELFLTHLGQPPQRPADPRSSWKPRPMCGPISR